MATNSIQILIQAKDNASKTLRGVADEMDSGSSKANKFGNALASVGKTAAIVGAAAAGALTAGLTLAAKASFDQVKAVEEARFGLQAYEKDGAKVEKVLSGLVAYARSDMGVLFNRKDMFAAASTLKMYGNETGTLTDRVKILSKGVSQGKTTFQELSAIVGRAAAKGKLDAVDFDMLIERGIGLDRSFRGADVSAQQLWEALDKALPDELLSDRANTIEGRMIRLQSAFREVGNAVLGVDADTNQFIKGGLGDQFMNGVMRATEILKIMTPPIRDIALRMAEMASGVAAFVEGAIPSLSALGTQIWDYLGPKVMALVGSVRNNLIPALSRLWKEVIEPMLPVIGTSLVVAVGLAIDAFKLLSDGISIGIEWFAKAWQKMKDGDPIIWALIGTLGSLGLALKLQAGFAAFTAGMATLRTVTIPATMLKVTALRTLIASPIGFGAIAIGAALGALALVKQAADDARAAIDQANSAADAELQTSKDLMGLARRQYDSGKIDETEFRRLVGVAAKATGTPYAQGGTTLVGENGPELVNLPRGSQVTQAYRTRSELAGEGAGGVTNNLSGNFTFQTAESVEAFFKRIDKTQRLARIGMAS